MPYTVQERARRAIEIWLSNGTCFLGGLSDDRSCCSRLEPCSFCPPGTPLPCGIIGPSDVLVEGVPVTFESCHQLPPTSVISWFSARATARRYGSFDVGLMPFTPVLSTYIDEERDFQGDLIRHGIPVQSRWLQGLVGPDHFYSLEYVRSVMASSQFGRMLVARDLRLLQLALDCYLHTCIDSGIVSVQGLVRNPAAWKEELKDCDFVPRFASILDVPALYLKLHRLDVSGLPHFCLFRAMANMEPEAELRAICRELVLSIGKVVDGPYKMIQTQVHSVDSVKVAVVDAPIGWSLQSLKEKLSAGGDIENCSM